MMYNNDRFALGIDIGTTTISAVAVNVDRRCLAVVKNIPNDTFIEGKPYERMQDSGRIIEKVNALFGGMCESCRNIVSVGLTGQMHGIVYVNGDGEAVSPLYTWQDGRAGVEDDDGMTVCGRIERITGLPISSGYGLATHYANMLAGEVPADAAKICTIHDYAVMKLTGRKTPLIHPSDAASFGLFDLGKCRFDSEAVKKLGIDESILPDVICVEGIAGYTPDGIPVSAAIGDNQAGFLGSVADRENSVLVNIGTGSQISKVSEYTEVPAGCELRPYVGGRYLMAASALCGGRAYAILERFFETFAGALGVSGDVYAVMEKLGADAGDDCGGVRFDPRFEGSRTEADARASINGLDERNFTPQNLIRALITGMIDELRNQMDTEGAKILVGSGNGVRKNALLRKIAGEAFGCDMMVPMHSEEAAFGAALCGMIGAGVLKNDAEAGEFVKYM